MSDVYALSPEQLRLCGMAVAVDVEKDAISSARAMLAGIPGAFKKAMGSALKRTATSGKAFAAKEIRREYFLKAADFKAHTYSNIQYKTDGFGTSVLIKYRGTHIPLINFNTFLRKNGHISVRVKRSSAREMLRNVFAQTMPNGHIGLYERETDERLPIRQLYGPAVPQMMSYNAEVQGKIQTHIKDEFKKRLDHEVTAILNGWRSV